jgi:hydroxymethylpyrimidine pyrophosphatase-like HAD family hydrolase
MGIGPEADIRGLQERLVGRYGSQRLTVQNLFAPNYGLHVMEIFAPGVDKWTGIRQMMADWRLTAEQVAAIGDDINDLELVREAGLGVAMANAIEAVKAVADVHTGSHDEDGVAQFIDRLLDGQFPC